LYDRVSHHHNAVVFCLPSSLLPAQDFIVHDSFALDASDVDARPTDGAYVYGMFLEGARWDNVAHTLSDSNPKELYVGMPVIHLSPVQNRPDVEEGIYRTPVYKTLTRAGLLSTTGHSTNFVMWLELASGTETCWRKTLCSETNRAGLFADSEKYIKAGVALFCSLRY
jgi:dynein heavy chain